MMNINTHFHIDSEMVSEHWHKWAEQIASLSPTYSAFARETANNQEVMTWLAGFPRDKHIPNLLLAAVRLRHGLMPDAKRFVDAVLGDRVGLAEIMLRRSVQTNEAARLAPILPILAQIQADSGQPLALIEVGASAGLCLMPDYCRFEYGDRIIRPRQTVATPAPLIKTSLTGTLPPFAMPQIGWRAGMDIAPIDLAVDQNDDWLRSLIFPEDHDRFTRLEAAIALRKQLQFPIFKGDLRSDLAAILKQVPGALTPVVFHTIVLYYLKDHHEAEAFGQSVWDLGAHWIAAETAETLPKHAYGLSLPKGESAVVVAHNSQPRAIAHPHGKWMQWLG